MNRKSWLILTVVAVLTIVPFVWANNAYAVESLKGKGSLAGLVSFQNLEYSNGYDSEIDMTNIQAAIGHFFTDNLEVNFAPMIMRIEPEGADDVLLYNYFVNLKYNFYQEGATTIPYLGVQTGITGYEAAGDDDSDLSYGAMGGVKFFVSEEVSVNLELNYLKTTFDADVGGDIDLDVTSLFVGLSWYFGG
jgi:opacity protein-like surface antigen